MFKGFCNRVDEIIENAAGNIIIYSVKVFYERHWWE